MLKKATYSPMAILLASPAEPLAKQKREFQLTQMWQALAALERATEATRNDWRICSDVVNLMTTLVAMQHLKDNDGLLQEATAALLVSAQDLKIPLDPVAAIALRAVWEDYASALEQIPARTILQAHRLTELRLDELRKANKHPAGPQVLSL